MVARFRWILTAFVTVYVTLVNSCSLRRVWLCVAVLVLSGGIVALALRRPLTLERLQLLGAFVLATDITLVLVAVLGDMAPSERGFTSPVCSWCSKEVPVEARGWCRRGRRAVGWG